MKRIAMGFGLGLGLAGALAACGGDEAQEAREATQVPVESAPQAGSPAGRAGEDTEVPVDSAPTGDEPAEE